MIHLVSLAYISQLFASLTFKIIASTMPGNILSGNESTAPETVIYTYQDNVHQFQLG